MGVDHHHHWQQSPFPENAPASQAAAANSFMAAGPHTMKVCLTQEQIDRYGAITPTSRSCQVANVVKGAHIMTAEWICSGLMSGKGTLESEWIDDSHAKGTVHFIGSIQAGPSPKPIEFTAESTSVFKSSDCGNVKPLAAPNKRQSE